MATFYNKGKERVLSGDFDPSNMKVLLTTSTYTPSVDNDEFRADVTNEVTGTNYTAGGITVDNTSVTVDNANDRSELSGDNPTFTNVSITGARIAVFYENVGSAATDVLLWYQDFRG